MKNNPNYAVSDDELTTDDSEEDVADREGSFLVIDTQAAASGASFLAPVTEVSIEEEGMETDIEEMRADEKSTDGSSNNGAAVEIVGEKSSEKSAEQLAEKSTKNVGREATAKRKRSQTGARFPPKLPRQVDYLSDDSD